MTLQRLPFMQLNKALASESSPPPWLGLPACCGSCQMPYSIVRLKMYPENTERLTEDMSVKYERLVTMKKALHAGLFCVSHLEV